MLGRDMEAMAKTGSVDDLANLLKAHGHNQLHNDHGHGTDFIGMALDRIIAGVKNDDNEARKAEKTALIAAYEAHGDQALKREPLTQPELRVLENSAFEGSSDDVTQLLKKFTNDQHAVNAIIHGVERDHKKGIFRHELSEDKMRRSNKRDVLKDFIAKANDFDPAADILPTDDLDLKIAEAERQHKLAVAQDAATKPQQAPAPGVKKLRL